MRCYLAQIEQPVTYLVLPYLYLQNFAISPLGPSQSLAGGPYIVDISCLGEGLQLYGHDKSFLNHPLDIFLHVGMYKIFLNDYAPIHSYELKRMCTI